MLRSPLALATLTLIASPVLAAGTAVFQMIPRSASIPSGGTMIVDLFIDYSGVTAGQEIAGWKFDILGHTNGTLTGDVNDAYYPNGVNNGAQSGSDLLDFSGGKLPAGLGFPAPNFIGTVSFTDSGTAATDYLVSLSVTDYVSPSGALNVYVSSSGAQSRSSLTSSTGTNHLVDFDIRPFQVIVPAPSALAVLGLLGLRRRVRYTA